MLLVAVLALQIKKLRIKKKKKKLRIASEVSPKSNLRDQYSGQQVQGQLFMDVTYTQWLQSERKQGLFYLMMIWSFPELGW